LYSTLTVEKPPIPAAARTTGERRLMTLPLEKLYLSIPECLIVLFDLRDSEAVERLHRERATWQELSDIQALSKDCFALILRPGGAQRLAA
jgi:hypothetical protein